MSYLSRAVMAASKLFLEGLEELSEDDPATKFANSRWSTACSPDEIIVAHILQSFLDDFEDWTSSTRVYSLPTLSRFNRLLHLNYAPYDRRVSLVRSRKGGKFIKPIKVEIRYTVKQGRPRKSWHYFPYAINPGHLWINDIEMESRLGLDIVKAYCEMRDALAQAEAVARRAQREMAINEEKWNLAENLLGMKRNEQGVLEPINKVSLAQHQAKALSYNHGGDTGGQTAFFEAVAPFDPDLRLDS